MTRRVGTWASLSLFGAALFTVAAAVPAAAIENETFGVAPHPDSVDGTSRRTFAVPLEPGAVFEDSLRVYNRTDQPLELLLYAADAEAGVDDTISIGFRGSRPKGVGAWIDLDRDSLNLPPRGETVVRFRVDVRSAEPVPDLGAIAVEHATEGVAANLAERLHLVVRTSAPNTPTTSVRVRPLLLRSPWIILAMLGLLVALIIVWLGARRARRPKDAVVPSGGLSAQEPEVTPAASKPVLRRLGQTSSGSSPVRRRQNADGVRSARLSRAGRSAAATRAPHESRDPRPLLDELLLEVDELDTDPAPRTTSPRAARARGGRPRKSTAARSQSTNEPRARKRRYIPLDDL